VFPHVDVTKVTLIGGAVLAAGLAAGGLAVMYHRRHAPAPVAEATEGAEIPREQWTMPPLTLLGRPEWSMGRKAAMLGLQVYLALSVIILVVKAAQLAGA